MKLTPAFLFAIAPGANPAHVAAIVQHQLILDRYGLIKTDDICFFFGQFALETSGITALEENLFYTTTARLRAVWPSRFKTDAVAAPYVRNPQKLANLVYAGRLGNVAPNDGYLYRGSGGFHTTGKYNFQKVQDATGVKCVMQPDLLREFPAALESACVYWRDNKLSRFVGDVKALTKAVQGGTGGLADRVTYTERALKAARVVSTDPVADPVAVSNDMLKLGSRGPTVAALQKRLIILGFKSVGYPDGMFGPATADAVKLFQHQHGLIADGIAGPKTLEMIQFGNAEPAIEPKLQEPSGLDKFLAWLIGLFRS